jgi:probable phosphoglycerate mutase
MIYLLRHGEIEHPGGRRFVGQTDFPLNEKGISQAQHWREALSKTAFERIYCSDLTRTRRTAEIIASGQAHPAKIQAAAELREISLGEWDGLLMAEVRERFPEEWRKRGEDFVSYRPPGGESFADLQARAVPFFEQIAALSTASGSLVVTHAGVIRVILCHILGMPPADLFRLRLDYACLNIVDCEKMPMQLAVMNFRHERTHPCQ